MEWKISVLYPGDHIRVKRDHYNHHGIYMGNGEVIHYTAKDGDGLNASDNVIVSRTSIEFFLKNGVAERAIYSRKERKRLNKTEDILRFANESIGQGNYDLITNNCETFANKICFKKSENIKRQWPILHFLARFFIKLSGIIPYWILVTPRVYYQSKKAKRECKNLKGGAIIISNHTSIFDYYVFMFKHLRHVIHTMVAEVVYNHKSLAHLCRILENIKIDRNDPGNVKAYNQAKQYLEKNKTILIFPEGHLEENIGVIDDIKPSAITLAFETNKPIIPYFIKGNYGLFKRAKYIGGEKIYVRELIKKDKLEPNDIKMVQQYIKNTLNKLKHQLHCYEEYKTQALVSKRTWVLDFIRITSFPIGYLILRAKKIYVGDKKKVRKAMKEKVLIAPNHTGMYDVVFMYLYFLSRRIRILAINNIWDVKILGFGFDRSGVIKYNREAKGGFDMNAFRETSGILEANGAVVLFPQGHITEQGLITEKLKGGLSLHSLRNNAPIVPVYFADTAKFFVLNRILVGDPIYPSDYFGSDFHPNCETVEKFNDIILKKMLELQEISKKYKRKVAGGNEQ